MKRYTALFLVTFAVVFIFGFAAIRYCEHSNRCDSLGFWYTAYGASIYAFLISVATVAAVAAVRAIQKT